MGKAYPMPPGGLCGRMTGQYYDGMEPETLLKLRFLSDLTPGPEGLPLFLLTEIQEGDPPRYRSRIALFDGALRLLTQEEARRPRYRAPFLYFLRRVGEREELFRLDLRGGEAERLTETAGVLDYALGPGGGVAFLALKEAPRPGGPRRFQGWPFKFDGRGLLPEGNVALYALEEGKVRLLLDRYPPPKEMVYAPEGLYLVMPEDARAQAEGRDTLFLLREGRLEKVYGGVGPIFALEWSPEGLFFLGHAFERGGGTEARLYHLRGARPGCSSRGASKTPSTPTCATASTPRAPGGAKTGSMWCAPRRGGRGFTGWAWTGRRRPSPRRGASSPSPSRSGGFSSSRRTSPTRPARGPLGHL